MSAEEIERRRRWRLVLGQAAEESFAGAGGRLEGRDIGLDRSLDFVYGVAGEGDPKGKGGRKAGRGRGAPQVAEWLEDIRAQFPPEVVSILQHDALERKNLKRLLLEPEVLKGVVPDIRLAADLLALKNLVPEKAKEAVREVIATIIRDLRARLDQGLQQAVRAALASGRRTSRPRFQDIDWDRTIRANLSRWLPEQRVLIPERRIGRARRKRDAHLEEVILCVDQSGSMAGSVIHSGICAAVLAGIPAMKTRLVVYDTNVVDLTEALADPVELLFGVQLGGGTDTAPALAYCRGLIQAPRQTHLVLISDLYDSAPPKMLAEISALTRSGVQVIVLLALEDGGKPVYSHDVAAGCAALGCPVFGCTPDLFAELMAAALKRQDLRAWAAGRGIALVSADPTAEPEG